MAISNAPGGFMTTASPTILKRPLQKARWTGYLYVFLSAVFSTSLGLDFVVWFGIAAMLIFLLIELGVDSMIDTKKETGRLIDPSLLTPWTLVWLGIGVLFGYHYYEHLIREVLRGIMTSMILVLLVHVWFARRLRIFLD